MSIFDDLLEQVQESDREIFSKYPEIRRQVEELEAQLSEADGLISAWEDYLYGPKGPDGRRQGGVWDDQHKTFKPVIQERKKLEEAQARIRQLEDMLAEGSDMSFDEILKSLRDRGFVTKDEIDPVLKTASQSVTRQDLERIVGGIESFYLRTASLPARHLAEFGEPMNFEEYIDFSRKNNLLGDPERAYEMFVSGRRAKIEERRKEEAEKELQAKLEQARREGIEEGKKIAAMGESGLPTDQGGGAAYSPAVVEAMKKAVKPDGSVEVPSGSKLGDGVRAAIAAKLYREGKLTGPVQ